MGILPTISFHESTYKYWQKLGLKDVPCPTLLSVYTKWNLKKKIETVISKRVLRDFFAIPITFELSSINNLSMIMLMVSDTGILLNKFSISNEAMIGIRDIFKAGDKGVVAV